MYVALPLCRTTSTARTDIAIKKSIRSGNKIDLLKKTRKGTKFSYKTSILQILLYIRTITKKFPTKALTWTTNTSFIHILRTIIGA